MAPLVEELYVRVLRPILFRLDAESAHRLTLALLAAAPFGRGRPDAPELRQRLFGIEFDNPVGLAAGMDKDVRAAGAWSRMGFGFVEFGTITPRPQPGNSPPRMWRLPEHRAVINRLGFPSAGMQAAARRLERLRRAGLRIRIGVNIGPNRETPRERVVEDCAALMRALGPLADFVAVNLSSPNTPGLRDWQAPERMREIFAALGSMRGEAGRRPALLVKLSPDLDESTLAAICAEAPALGLDGILATNTTLAREAVGVSSPLEGGLSGRPLRERSRAIIRELYRRTGARLPIIGVGGVSCAEDAYRHIRAGASAIELYTALIYSGPTLVSSIKSGIARLLEHDRLGSITEAVGLEA